MKKISYPAVSLLLCISLLCSCGGKAPAPAETTAAQTQAAAAPEASEQTDAETTAAAESAAETAAAEGYSVLVTDEDGVPVQGATIQFCSDIECIMGTTGADGIAVFNEPEGSYTAHVLKAPDGYEKDSTEYVAVLGTTEIVLKKTAAEVENEVSEEDICEIPTYGVTFTVVPKYKNVKGTIDIDVNDLSMENPSVHCFSFDYYGIHAEDVELFNEYMQEYLNSVLDDTDKPEPPKEHWDDWDNLHCNLFTVFSIDSDRSEDELREQIAANTESGIKNCEKLDTCGNTTFYLVQFTDADDNDERNREYMGDLYDEFRDLLDDKETFLSSVELYEPVPAEAVERHIGDVISFETTDLDGNPVSSEDIFAGHKVTMINIWATWCTPCKKELPELGTLSKEFEEKDCQIIGICTDATDEKAIERAKTIYSENGCDFIDLTPPKDLDKIMPCRSIPSSYFVDSEGRIIAEKVVGANVARYTEIIDEYLASAE